MKKAALEGSKPSGKVAPPMRRLKQNQQEGQQRRCRSECPSHILTEVRLDSPIVLAALDVAEYFHLLDFGVRCTRQPDHEAPIDSPMTL